MSKTLNVRRLAPDYDGAQFIYYLITVPGQFNEEEVARYLHKHKLPDQFIVGEIWQMERETANPDYGYDPEAAAKDLSERAFHVSKRPFKGE